MPPPKLISEPEVTMEQISVYNLLNIMAGNNIEYIQSDRRSKTVVIEDKEIVNPGGNEFFKVDFPLRIEFNRCKFTTSLSFGPSNFKNNILFDECEFLDGLWWRNCQFQEFFSFRNCKFYKTANFTAFDCYRFHFDDCLFNDLLVLAEGKTKRSEDRGYGRFGGDLGNIKAKHIILDNNDFAWLTIYYHHIGKIEIESGSYERRILLHKSVNPDQYPSELTETTIGELLIRSKAKDSIGEIYASNCEANVIEINGELNNGSIIFEDVKVKTLCLNKFTNTSNLKFIRLSPLNEDAEVKFIESYLGKAQFFEVNLKSFSKLYIDNSHLTDILTTYTTWPNQISTKDNNPDKLKENYRQLKVAMKKQEDNFQALIFEQEEMNAYGKSLELKDEHWQEKFILWTSRESNYFGKDWITPVVWMIIFNFFFFFLIGASIHWKDVLGQNQYLQNMGRVVHLFNPAHQANLVHEQINLNNLALVVDFVSRIFTSYFLFQTIKAFRKYSK